MTDIDIVAEGSAAAYQRGRDSQVISVRPGSVISADATVAIVSMDEDDELTDLGDDVLEAGGSGAQVVYATGVRPGDRVLVMFTPASGAFVMGRRGGDFSEWTYVGAVDADGVAQGPPFEDDFENAVDTGLPSSADYAEASFRRCGRTVELRGRVWRTAGSGINIFTLPDECRPLNKVAIPVVGGVSGTVGINYVVVNRNGVVQAGSLIDLDEPTGSIFLDGVTYTVDDVEPEEIP